MRIVGTDETNIARRFDLIDVVRGIAIIGVVVYHLVWDLSFLQFISTDIVAHPVWRNFARSLAGTFLLVVGVNLTIAHKKGIRWPAFRRRLAVVAAAALGITAVTYVVFPDSFIFFGILHAIALYSILALPFLYAPLWLVSAAAFVVLGLPIIFRFPIFNERALAWIGLATQPPPTNDYEPLFPWFGVVLIGLAGARLVLGSPLRERLARWQAGAPFSRFLVKAGRWSLLIYLIHQPLLLSVLYPVSHLTGFREAAETASFLSSCEASCTGAGGEAFECRSGCSCAIDAIKANGLWSSVRRRRLSPAEEAAVNTISRQCFDEAERGRSETPP
jgi:uncharacterized membrane protein